MTYPEIKRYNYVIDTRGPNFILIKGQWAQKFKSFNEAIEFAINKIGIENASAQ